MHNIDPQIPRWLAIIVCLSGSFVASLVFITVTHIGKRVIRGCGSSMGIKRFYLIDTSSGTLGTACVLLCCLRYSSRYNTLMFSMVSFKNAIYPLALCHVILAWLLCSARPVYIQPWHPVVPVSGHQLPGQASRPDLCLRLSGGIRCGSPSFEDWGFSGSFSQPPFNVVFSNGWFFRPLRSIGGRSPETGH